jgi:methylenetetrahydrofolate reductase (NADPH)
MTHIVDKINDRRRERRRRRTRMVVLERRAVKQQHQVKQQEQGQQDKVGDGGGIDDDASMAAPGVAAAGAALEPPPPPLPDRHDHHHHHDPHHHLALLPPLYYSFEFFPPKTEAGVRNLQARIERMVQTLDPLFVSVTFAPQSYHTTLDLASYVQRYLGVDVCLHVTCQGMNRLEMKLVLNQARHAGIQNLLVLRGDPPPGQSRWKQGQHVQGNESSDDGGGVFPRAIDLVKWIKQTYGDWFGLAVAGHPEGQSVPDPTRTKATGTNGGDIPEDKRRTPSSSSSSSSNLSDEEIVHLKEKVEAGADLIVTQFYYDAATFADFVKRCRALGIACPIVPGILPVQSYSTLVRMTTYCGVHVPPALEEQVRNVQTNDEQVKDLGCQHAVEMCRTALDICVDDCMNADDSDDCYGGVDGLHFYTLNLERSVTRVLAGLGALDDDDDVPGGGSPIPLTTSDGPSNAEAPTTATTTTTTATTSNAGAAALSPPPPPTSKTSSSTSGLGRRQLPWRPSALTQRSQERVRPINWANRPRSYVMRTDDWDEFPNGRWGDASSPAFGELSALSHFYSSPVPVAAAGAYGYNDGNLDDDDPRRMLGGFPQTHHDLYEVFARYVEGRIPSIPWCESPLQAESFLIQEQLAQLNREGFLTINSQPSVNGASSSHKTFGWGHPNGYVYQKAYCECFCSPDRVHRLRGVVARHPSMVLYAINAADAVSLTRTNRTRASSASSKSKTAPLPETVVMVSGDGPGMMMGDGVTALTWGVFPNKEVIQPTIFDPETFLGVWAEEAFSLWDAWIHLYDPGTASRALLESIRDSYFLCAIVDNDYVSAPTNAAAATAASAPTTTTTTKTVRGGTADPPLSSAAGPSSNHLWDAMLRS